MLAVKHGKTKAWSTRKLPVSSCKGADPASPDEFSARIRLEMEKWGKVVRDADLKIE